MPTLAKTNETVAGYKLKARLGAGGYGEVWSADAPGGLVKAVKFIYGYLDEDRAKRELKSLNRVKDVRHPFLLSLERIEVVEGQLVIVTELAESSLKERFIECRKKGLPGIPRDELMVYVRDTAEALDYMREKHELQHLDVKPENLLLVGGRVKVADFGLVKDIGERTFTMMGGLTPLYAPPEVFEGHPSHHSDQYSLAIVFQELLTGRVPFSGKSAARLGLQHAKAPPDLSSLPDEDRPAVERALAKDPSRRFPSCMTLIDALAKGTSEADESLAHVRVRKAATKTEAPSADVVRSPQLRRLLSDQPISNGKPFDMLNTSHHCRPTLFLGFGGTAGAVLDRIKQRMHRRFAGKSVEAIRFLQTDVDQRALNHLVSLHGPGLSAEETLALPLRRPEYYRTRASGYQKWVSRRWLYNIPRSLTTEGLRPLARLAFVDNAPKLFDRIRAELKMIADPEVLRRSAEAALAPFESTCRIVLVASVSGATGGGMVLDAAFAARQIAAEIGLEQAQICGVLVHATGGDLNDRELGIVNAYAALKELLYYRQIRYPGDEDCGLNPAAGDRAAFDDIYFASNGDAEREFTELIEEVSEYLYVDTATEGGSFMDACRRAARRSTDESDECYVQLFGIHREEFLNEWEIDAHVRKLTRGVFHWWRGVERTPPEDSHNILMQTKKRAELSPARREKLDALVHDAVQSLDLDRASLAPRVKHVVQAEINASPEQLLRGLISNARESTDAPPTWWSQCQEDLTRLFGEVDEPAGSTPLATKLLEQLREQAAALANRVMSWIQQAFALSTARLAGARYLGQTFLDQLKHFEEEQSLAVRTGRDRFHEAGRMIQQLLYPKDRRRPAPTVEELQAALERAALARYFVFENDLARRFARTVYAKLSKEMEALFDLDVAIKGLELRIPHNEKAAPGGFLAQFTDDARILRLVSDKVLRKLDLEPTDLFRGLQSLLQTPDQALETTAACSQETLLDAVRQMEETADATNNANQQIKRCLDAAKPVIQDCGGRQRLLIMAPASLKRGAIRKGVRESLGVTPSVICTGVDFVACYELEKVSLPRIAAKLVDGRQDFVDCAMRVHTRKDIDWEDAFVQ